MSQLESVFGTSTEDDRKVAIYLFQAAHKLTISQTLMKVVQELDKTLFDGYVKPKSAVVTSILKEGISDPAMDWYETPHPTGTSSCSATKETLTHNLEIRPYMYRVLMTIVGIHAQISHVAEGLLERALHVLVEDAADEALRSFRQVKRFGMGGMLRVSCASDLSHLDH